MVLESPPTGVWVLIATAITVAALAHWRLRRYLLALAVSVLATPTLFFVVSSIQSGIPDGPYLAPFLAYAIVALVISAIIGVLFTGCRRLVLRGT